MNTIAIKVDGKVHPHRLSAVQAIISAGPGSVEVSYAVIGGNGKTAASLDRTIRVREDADPEKLLEDVTGKVKDHTAALFSAASQPRIPASPVVRSNRSMNLGW